MFVAARLTARTNTMQQKVSPCRQDPRNDCCSLRIPGPPPARSLTCLPPPALASVRIRHRLRPPSLAPAPETPAGRRRPRHTTQAPATALHPPPDGSSLQTRLPRLYAPGLAALAPRLHAPPRDPASPLLACGPLACTPSLRHARSSRGSAPPRARPLQPLLAHCPEVPTKSRRLPARSALNCVARAVSLAEMRY